jgi:hypothetical protein
VTGQVHPSHTLSEKLFKQLKALTKNNYAGEAYQAAAQALGLSELEREFNRINLIHVRAGHLSPELNQTRRRAYDELLRQAKSMLTLEQHQRLYMCF